MATSSMPSEFKPVLILWRDACVHPGWHNLEDLEDMFKSENHAMETIGYLVGENDESVFIANAVGKVRVSDVLQIAKNMITDRFEL